MSLFLLVISDLDDGILCLVPTRFAMSIPDLRSSRSASEVLCRPGEPCLQRRRLPFITHWLGKVTENSSAHSRNSGHANAACNSARLYAVAGHWTRVNTYRRGRNQTQNHSSVCNLLYTVSSILSQAVYATLPPLPEPSSCTVLAA